MVFLCIPGCRGTCYVDLVGFQLTKIPLPLSVKVRLKVCITISSVFFEAEFHSVVQAGFELMAILLIFPSAVITGPPCLASYHFSIIVSK